MSRVVVQSALNQKRSDEGKDIFKEAQSTNTVDFPSMKKNKVKRMILFSFPRSLKQTYIDVFEVQNCLLFILSSAYFHIIVLLKARYKVQIFQVS